MATAKKKSSSSSKSAKSTSKSAKSSSKSTKSPSKSAKGPSRKVLEVIEEKLRSEREDLLRQREELERGHSEAENGEADVADVGTATFARERDLSLMENVRDLLGQIDDALEKIDKGTYGVCESCGKRIEAARLKALPYAALCIECKRAQGRR